MMFASQFQKPILASALFLAAASPAVFAAKSPVLAAVKTQTPITVDGQAETAWQDARFVEILLDEIPYEPNNGYEGAKRTKVNIQALYDQEFLYMKFVWADKTKSLARFPWEKQKDGTWKHLKNLDSTLHENTYYEDKFAVYWNISEKGFAKKGCDKSCHIAEEGMLEGVKDSSAGRHYTLAGTLDEWHWKATRTNVNYQMDDGYLDSEHETNKKWGRHPDKKTGGGYYNNMSEDKSEPGWMSPATVAAAGVEPIYHLLESEKEPFVDQFQPGDRLPGIITAPFEGPRADVEAFGYWQDGQWTLEIKRKLVTEDDPTLDRQFDNLNEIYYFGVTVFDNAQIAHIHHTGSIKLTFQQ